MSFDLFFKSNISLASAFAQGKAPSADVKEKIVEQVSNEILETEKTKSEITGNDSNYEIVSGMNSRHLLQPAVADFLDRLFLLEPVDNYGMISTEEQELVDSLVKEKVVPALVDTYKEFSFAANNEAREYLLKSIRENDLTADIENFYDNALAYHKVVVKEHGDYDAGLDTANIALLNIMRKHHFANSDTGRQIDTEIDAVRDQMAYRNANNEGYSTIRRISQEESQKERIDEVETPLDASPELKAKFPDANFRNFNTADMRLMFELGIIDEGVNRRSSYDSPDSFENRSLREFEGSFGFMCFEATDYVGNPDYKNAEQRLVDLNFVMSRIDVSGLTERSTYIGRAADLANFITDFAQNDSANTRALLRTIQSQIEKSSEHEEPSAATSDAPLTKMHDTTLEKIFRFLNN